MESDSNKQDHNDARDAREARDAQRPLPVLMAAAAAVQDDDNEDVLFVEYDDAADADAAAAASASVSPPEVNILGDPRRCASPIENMFREAFAQYVHNKRVQRTHTEAQVGMLAHELQQTRARLDHQSELPAQLSHLVEVLLEGLVSAQMSLNIPKHLRDMPQFSGIAAYLEEQVAKLPPPPPTTTTTTTPPTTPSYPSGEEMTRLRLAYLASAKREAHQRWVRDLQRRPAERLPTIHLSPPPLPQTFLQPQQQQQQNQGDAIEAAMTSMFLTPSQTDTEQFWQLAAPPPPPLVEPSTTTIRRRRPYSDLEAVAAACLEDDAAAAAATTTVDDPADAASASSDVVVVAEDEDQRAAKRTCYVSIPRESLPRVIVTGNRLLRAPQPPATPLPSVTTLLPMATSTPLRHSPATRETTATTTAAAISIVVTTSARDADEDVDEDVDEDDHNTISSGSFVDSDDDDDDDDHHEDGQTHVAGQASLSVATPTPKPPTPLPSPPQVVETLAAAEEQRRTSPATAVQAVAAALKDDVRDAGPSKGRRRSDGDDVEDDIGDDIEDDVLARSRRGNLKFVPEPLKKFPQDHEQIYAVSPNAVDRTPYEGMPALPETCPPCPSQLRGAGRYTCREVIQLLRVGGILYPKLAGTYTLWQCMVQFHRGTRHPPSTDGRPPRPAFTHVATSSRDDVDKLRKKFRKMVTDVKDQPSMEYCAYVLGGWKTYFECRARLLGRRTQTTTPRSTGHRPTAASAASQQPRPAKGSRRPPTAPPPKKR